VPCGGSSTLPSGVNHAGNKYECLNFSFLTNPACLLDSNIFCNDYDGISFAKDHVHHPNLI
jgi:hypothetical protein